MSQITQLFLFQLQSICSTLWSAQGKSMALLLTSGNSQDPLSWKIFHEYKNWGLLHLLVLSGSQYYAFADAWLRLTLGIQKFFFRVSSPFFSRALLFPAGFLYLSALKMPPPLLRCALLSMAYELLRPMKWKNISVIAIVFVLHIFFIESFVPSDSAFLSWLAFFTLQFANYAFQNKILRTLLITLLLQLAINIFKEIPFSFRALFIACLSNLISLPLFERFVFPCIGYVSAFCLLLCPLFLLGLSPSFFKDFLALPLSSFLDLAILPVLVANSAFRYTFYE